MKKGIIIAVIAAAVAGIAAGLVFSFKSSSDTEPDYSVPTPLYGNYYLNGDKESGAYVELTEDTVVLKGDRVEEYFRESIIDFLGDDITEEDIERNLKRDMEQFAVESEYVVGHIGLDDVPYAIFNSWNKDKEVINNKYSGASGYWYNGTDKLTLGGIGDFIYISE